MSWYLLKPGILLNSDLQVQGQKLPVSMTRTVVQKGGNWDISDSVTVMGRAFTAMSSFVQGSLLGVKQVAVQGR